MSEKCELKIGTVMPSEYDWRGQFREMCKDIIFEGTVDTGKVWGLCCEIDRLTAERDELEEDINRLTREIDRAISGEDGGCAVKSTA